MVKRVDEAEGDTWREKEESADLQQANNEGKSAETESVRHVGPEESGQIGGALLSVEEVALAKHTSRESNGSSEEEEDWDRHSSEEEGQDSTRDLPRSDTQATVMPVSHRGQIRADKDTPGTISTPARGPCKQTHLIEDLTRARTSSTQSSSSLNTVIQYASVPPSFEISKSFNVPCQRPKTSHVEQSQRESQHAQRQPHSAPNNGNLRRSTGTSTLNTAVSTAKLAMTSEAMPVLLAKIREAKEHCSTCVTELR